MPMISLDVGRFIFGQVPSFVVQVLMPFGGDPGAAILFLLLGGLTRLVAASLPPRGAIASFLLGTDTKVS